jgi:hypothetical protein
VCEGADDDEVRFTIHANILRFGWHVTAVVADRVSESWAYTIGLVGFGHPEFAGHLRPMANRCARSAP